MGLPYVFADFINPDSVAAAAYYREHFRPSDLLQAPRTGVAMWAICADTDQEAFRLSLSFRMAMIMLYRGQAITVPPVETAERFLEREGVPAELLPMRRRVITGCPAKVHAAVEAVAREYCADEVFLVNIMYSHAARRRSYELIAPLIASAKA